MSPETARSILGLGPDPSPEAVDEAFRKRASQAHPDHGGSSKAFQELVEARDALKKASSTAVIVPLDAVRDLLVQISTPSRTPTDRHEDAQVVVRSVIRVGSSRLREMRRSLSFMTLLLAIFAGLPQVLARLMASDRSRVANEMLGTLTGIMAVFLALCALLIAYTTYAIASLQTLVEDFDQFLGNRADVAALVGLIVGTSGLPMSAAEWFNAVERWLMDGGFGYKSAFRMLRSGAQRGEVGPPVERVAWRIGPGEFARLVLAKAKEHEVLMEHDHWAGDQLEISIDYLRGGAK